MNGVLINPETRRAEKLTGCVSADFNGLLGSPDVTSSRLVIEGIPCIVIYDDVAYLKSRPVSVYGSGCPPIRGPVVVMHYSADTGRYDSLSPGEQNIIIASVEDGTVLAQPYIKGWNC